jgi:1,2-phenylacetyl-CoA epoxidase PaaB subunit
MSENEQKNAQPATPAADEGEVFEVFQQDLKDPTPHHGGNLVAPDAELAVHYAKEFYGRRQESHKLWIVPRSAMLEVSDLTHLPPSLHALPNTHPTQEQPHQTFAVFVQKHAGKHLIWLRDLEDMSPAEAAEAAIHNAQNSEGGYLRLWLCPRSAIVELTDPNLLQPPLDRSYRRLDGYNIREKLRAARQRVQAQAQEGGEK